MPWQLRVRGPSGQATLAGLGPESTVGALLEACEGAGIGVCGAPEVLAGFPPKQLKVGRARAVWLA